MQQSIFGFIVFYMILICGRSEPINQNRDLQSQEYVGDQIAKQTLREATAKVERAVKRTLIKWMKEDVWEDPMTLFQFFKQPPNQESVRMAMAGDVFECALNMVQDKILEHHPMRIKRMVNATELLSREALNDLIKFSGCKPTLETAECSNSCLSNLYRTHDGRCNNAAHPWWGAANIPLGRWRPSQYENDFSTPIGWDPDRLYNSFKLPIVRKVSNDVIGTTNQHVTGDPEYSHMLVVWGQYIDHDMDLTPQSSSTSTFQGLTDCSKTCKNEPPCYPMQVSPDDPRVNGSCLPFIRSASVCGIEGTSSFSNALSPREQINAVTSFLDASTVYGSSENLSKTLRDLTKDDGLLRVNTPYKDDKGRAFLPPSLTNPCVQDPQNQTAEDIPCFLAGDSRVSEHLTLSAIHTIWVREHNRIARMLKRMNPHWSGEILYQEARKIVGAYHQVVHYNAYLPKILGKNGMKIVGNYTGYKPNENPAISNVFATAAFRFGHVTISPDFRRLDENFNNHPQFPTILLHQAFFSPWRMIRQGGLDPILRGLIGRPAKLATTSQIMHEELREKLFALQNKVALDLASLNLQRGRDHALPLYNDWREECGLPRATNFSQLANEIKNETIRDKLEALYGHPGNMDVWMAGLAEDLEEGSRLGPTFSCLIGRQFRFLRNGDKFYYENPGVFTSDQVKSLKNMTLARLLCDNSGLTHVQRGVFSLADFPRDFVSCDQIPTSDLSPWRESPEMASCGRIPDIKNGYWRKCGAGVSYRCYDGYLIEGKSFIECVDASFTIAPPSCKRNDSNYCTNNNGCQDICDNKTGNCSCYNGSILTSDGKSCMTKNKTNVSSIVSGIVCGTITLIIIFFLVNMY